MIKKWLTPGRAARSRRCAGLGSRKASRRDTLWGTGEGGRRSRGRSRWRSTTWGRRLAICVWPRQGGGKCVLELDSLLDVLWHRCVIMVLRAFHEPRPTKHRFAHIYGNFRWCQPKRSFFHLHICGCLQTEYVSGGVVYRDFDNAMTCTEHARTSARMCHQ